MREVDLNGVALHRRAEVRKRVEAILDYLSLPAPTREDDRRHAERLGIGEAAFLRLVRIWLDHGRASELDGARGYTAAPRRATPWVAHEVEAVIATALGELGLGIRPTELRRVVVERCAQLGLVAPTDTSIHERLYRARSRADVALGEPPFIVLDHSALRIAVVDGGAAQVPVLTVAFALPARRVLAHELRSTPPGPQAAAVVLSRALRDHPPGDERAGLRLNADYTPDWNRILSALAAAGVERVGSQRAPVSSTRLLRATFGVGIGGLRFQPLATHRPTESSGPPLSGISKALEMEDAADAVAEALVRHNDGLGPAVPRAMLADPGREAELIAMLEEVAARTPETPRRRRTP